MNPTPQLTANELEPLVTRVETLVFVVDQLLLALEHHATGEAIAPQTYARLLNELRDSMPLSQWLHDLTVRP
jgi:hypothetical protein